MTAKRFRLSRKFFNLIRGLYPKSVRDTYGEELDRFFIGTLESETKRIGVLGIPYVWWNTILDLVFRRGQPMRLNQNTTRAGLLGSIREDVRVGARTLRRQPGYALAVIVTLVVGIGANVAMFSLLHAVLVRPLPFPEPSRLVLAWSTNSQLGLEKEGPSPGDVLEWAESNNSLQSLAGWYMTSGTYQEEDYAEELIAVQATADFFQVLGVNAAVGKVFSAPDVVSAFGPVVISHSFWQRRFGGDPSIVGSNILVSGQSRLVVGVMPADFSFPSRDVDLWTAWDLRLGYAHLDGVPRTWRFLNAIARINPDTEITAAEADLQRVAANLANAYPASNAGWSVRLESLFEDIVAEARPGLLMGFAAVGFLLLLTCVNVANMLLARLPSRANELAVRAALGASKPRLVRQLLTEIGMMVAGATAIGLVVALGLMKTIVRLNANTLPRIEDASMDTSVYLFALVLTVGVTLVCGAAPAIHVTRAINPAHGNLTRIGTTKTTRRLRHGLVVGQLAIAVVLLIGAGLFWESFRRLRATDLGYDQNNVLTYRLSLNARPDQTGYVEPYYKAVIDSMKSIPGVVTAGASTTLPLDPVGNDFNRPYRGPTEQTSSAEAAKGQMRIVTPDYFDTIGLRFHEGGSFTGNERVEGQRVAIVNRRLADQQWPERNAIGQQLMIDFRDGWQPYTIVGVVADVKHYGARADAEAEIFVPASQIPYLAMSVAVRTTTPPELLIPAVDARLRSIDPTQPAHNFNTLASLRSDSVAEDRFLLMVFAVFGAVAVILAATGIYGVMAYAVSQRKHEIGVRLALGAKPQTLARSIIGQAMMLAIIGLMLGIVAAWQLGRFVEQLLYLIDATNVVVFLGVGMMLFALASLAAVLPAHRSTQIAPTEALRPD